MNVMGEMFKDETKWGNCQKQLLEVVCVFDVLEFIAI
jgi:hypothetical protein